jgi:hypothetical protein
MDKVEHIARSLCIADGVDPNGYTRLGFMGLFGPTVVNWTGYIRQAIAAIEAMEKN